MSLKVILTYLAQMTTGQLFQNFGILNSNEVRLILNEFKGNFDLSGATNNRSSISKH